MTKEELRKIFDDAEKAVCNPDVTKKIFDEITDPSKLPSTNPAELAIRVNQVLNKEILLEVLSKVLTDK